MGPSYHRSGNVVRRNEGWTTVEVLWRFQGFPVSLPVAFLVGYHSLSINYFSLISAVVIKHYDTKQLRGGDVLFSLQFQYIIHHWKKSRQELESRPACDHTQQEPWKVLLTG